MSKDALKDSLIRFMTDYTILLSKQLNAIHKEMEGAVEIVMNGVSNISDETRSQVKKAQTVLVKDQKNTNTFSEADGEQLSQEEKKKIFETSSNGQVKMDKTVVKIGMLLRNQMDSLGSLEGELENAMFEIIGKMSSDDVVRQRVEHICYLSNQLSEDVGRVYRNVDTMLAPDAIEKLEKEFLGKIKRSYTMEDEKEIFKKVFNG